MEKLETDVTKLRQKAEDVEYLKKRVLVRYMYLFRPFLTIFLFSPSFYSPSPCSSFSLTLFLPPLFFLFPPFSSSLFSLFPFFYSLQELKQQNELMIETKTLLEQKVTTLTSKADSVDELQVEIASYKVQLDALNQEKQMDMERIEELVAQTARLELENKSK